MGDKRLTDEEIANLVAIEREETWMALLAEVRESRARAAAPPMRMCPGCASVFGLDEAHTCPTHSFTRGATPEVVEALREVGLIAEQLHVEIEAWRDHQETTHRGGQSVGYHGYQFMPSTARFVDVRAMQIRDCAAVALHLLSGGAGTKEGTQMMPSCEKCWREAGGDPDRYAELIRRGPACTPEQQAGPDRRPCARCGRTTIHQHAGVCMVCGAPEEETRPSSWDEEDTKP